MEEQSSDAEPDLWIWICIIKVGSRSVWRDRNPDKGHTRNPRMTRRRTKEKDEEYNKK